MKHSHFFESYQKKLKYLESRSQKRVLTKPQGIDFTSNDYLSFACSPRIRHQILRALENGLSIGAGGSRLLRGNHEEFEKLEEEAAEFFRCKKSIYLSSGYLANLAIFSTFPQRNDCIFYDELIHASMRDGIAQSRSRSTQISHNNIEHFESEIKQWRNSGGTGRPWIAVESIYSMDGDCAPLKELLLIAKQYDGFLIIDEAHATGVFGEYGKGLSAFDSDQENTVILHTCGKALGSAGALICLSQTLYDYFINYSRPFIFSTSPSPLIAVAVREALKMLCEDESYQENLKTLVQFANKQIKETLNIHGHGTQILPVIIGSNQRAIHIARCLQKEGFDIRAIRPPTVKVGTARLRIAITLHVNKSNISDIFSCLKKNLEENEL